MCAEPKRELTGHEEKKGNMYHRHFEKNSCNYHRYHHYRHHREQRRTAMRENLEVQRGVQHQRGEFGDQIRKNRKAENSVISQA